MKKVYSESASSLELKRSFNLLGFLICISIPVTSITLSGQESVDDDDEVFDLQPFSVTGGSMTGYTPSSTLSATRINLKLLDLPHSVHIVTYEQMRDMGLASLGEAARYVSNTDTRSTIAENISIRGFGSGTTLVDGVQGGDVLNSERPPIFVERVEVIKGASAVLYGAAQPGGLVNHVTAKPLTYSRNMVSARAGNNGYLEFEVDSTAPLDEDNNLRYRFSASYMEQDHEVLRKLNQHVRWGVFPQIYYSPWDGTELLLQYTHEEWEGTAAGSIPTPYWNYATNEPWKLPRNWYRGELRDTNDKERDWLALTWIQAFNENWHLKVHGSYMDIFGVQEWAYTRNVPGDPESLIRNFRHLERPLEVLNGQFDLVGNIETGPVQHKILLGGQLRGTKQGDYYTDRYYPTFPLRNPTYGNELYSGQEGLQALIDEGRAGIGNAYVSTPEYGGVYPGASLYKQGLAEVGEVMSDVRNRFTDTSTKAFYWQEIATFFDERLHVTIGGRWDYFMQTTVDHGRPEGHPLGPTDTRITHDDTELEFFPRYAVLYKVNPSFSVFALYNESMIPSLGTEPTTGQRFAPEIGEHTEGGVKWSLFDGRLTGSASVFEIVKTNIKETDAVRFITVQQGEATADGWEIDLHYQVTDEFQLLAGYSKLDQEVTDSQAQQYQGDDELVVQSPVGDVITNIPDSMGYFWGKYSFLEGTMKGLSVALGMTHHGSRYIESDRSLALPSATVWDGMISYAFQGSLDGLKIQLNVNNIEDKLYWTAGAGTFGERGLYRKVRVRVSYVF